MPAASGRVVAGAQTFISALFIGGYFLVLAAFLLGWVKPDPEYKEMMIALLGVITGSLSTIIAFWFSRSRPQDQPGGPA